MSRNLYAIGRITKAFGIKGDVIIRAMTPDANRFTKLKQVFVGTDERNVEEVSVSSVSSDHRGVRIALENITDRTAAEQSVGLYLFVDEKDRIKLPSKAYFVDDLRGMKVQLENGEAFGELKDVLKLPGHDIYVIDHEGKEVMIPAVKEFIRSVDLPERLMTVRVIEGMVE